MTVASSTRTIVLLRHAKAEHVYDKSDHDRDLTPRGRRDAQEAGRWLHDAGFVADLALCSSSERTRQTWDEACFGGAGATRTAYEPLIYSGGTGRVLQRLRELDDDVDRVIVVGHAPVMPDLTSLLSSGEGSLEAHDALGEGFPTSGLAMLDFSGDWQHLGVGTCALRRFHVARGE